MNAAWIQQALADAVKLHRAGRLNQAEQAYRKILAAAPDHADALYLLGSLLHYIGDLDQSIDLIRRAITIEPGVAEYHNNLGTTLLDRGDISQARKAFETSIRLDPKLVEARVNLARALTDEGHPNQAIPELQRSIELQPDFVRAYNELGRAYRMLGQLDEAASAYEKAIELRPNASQGHNNLGNIFKDQGDLDRAIECYRCAVSLQKRSYSIGHSNLISAMQFHPAYDMADLQREQKLWNEQYTKPLASSIRPHLNSRDPDRPLRIGYVSPDFRDHVVGRNLLPLLQNHDHRQFQIFCYAYLHQEDQVTNLFRGCADGWRAVAALDDQKLSELVRADQIDILLDLSLHMAGNRLLVFATKPAPVQVTFAGYPGSTGLETIDYRLSDPYLDPPGLFDRFYSEQTLLLPSFWCYQPLHPEPLSPLPSLASGKITFGCLNNFCKVNPQVLKLWARVLQQVKSSRLLLLSDPGQHRQKAIQQLEVLGVEGSRVEFVRRLPHQEYIKQYHRIDIALDTLPYNGHTTSLEGLWMGVPLVTLVGRTVVGRAGLSQLSNLGLTDLAATSEEQFLTIATELAGDVDRLTKLRQTLRQRMEQSVLMDAKGFAGNIETQYRTMWKRWCEAGS